MSQCKLYKADKAALPWTNSKILTDALGYRTIKQQVEQFQHNGLRLEAYRAGFYDSDSIPDNESTDDLATDPTRSYGFDFADAHELVSDLRARMTEQYHRKQAAAQAAAAKAWADYHAGKGPDPRHSSAPPPPPPPPPPSAAEPTPFPNGIPTARPIQ